ncbi:hypothetical protein N8I74_14545 [Chitiniphilus purpureus]|uniref:Chitinase A N-terminal domain-containing protein n=1 Tax=Chitiniphilus purpureus TaxID=2981137 RepID=A0ABY6DLE9_9NEIS|nr:chitinase N-terminal domain-containing protein [Chitiniphilus sp. CD1]UXY14528.1 hypothetical protein N8I74_14545 [Chitiniphilus sp. CD1]
MIDTRLPALLLAIALPLAHAVLLTPGEAEEAGERACTARRDGMLECVDLPPPAPPPRNDPSIQPLPPIEYPGEQFPPPVTEAPIRPALDPIPDRLAQDRLTIGWDINFGTTAQYWEIWDNGTLRMRSRDFTSRTVAGGSVEDATPVGSSRVVSVQSGVYTLEALDEGRHELLIRLCNTDRAGKPACTDLEAQTWVEEAQMDDGAADPELPTGRPSVPELAWLPQVSTGEPIELAWNVWWGTPGRYWQVLNDGRVQYESTTFTESGAYSQAGRITLAGLPRGVHPLSVRLCNQLQCAQSAVVDVEVLLPPEGEPRPRVTVAPATPDSVLLSWSLPQAQLAGRPQRWQLFDALADEALAEPLGNLRSDVRTCQQTDPATPGVATASYCGETRVPLHAGLAALRVRVCHNDEDCLTSEVVSLRPEATPAPRQPQRTAPAALPAQAASEVPEAQGAIPAPRSAPAPVAPGSTRPPQPRGRFVLPDEVLDSLLDERELSAPQGGKR